jgi:hypothetical protein
MSEQRLLSHRPLLDLQVSTLSTDELNPEEIGIATLLANQQLSAAVQLHDDSRGDNLFEFVESPTRATDVRRKFACPYYKRSAQLCHGDDHTYAGKGFQTLTKLRSVASTILILCSHYLGDICTVKTDLLATVRIVMRSLQAKNTLSFTRSLMVYA